MFAFKECREMRGYTQKYVAISLGVKAPSVSDWENGKTNPTLDNLVALSKLLDVSTDMLLGETPIRESQIETSMISQSESQMLEDFRSLNRQGKEYVLQSLAMAVTIYKNDSIPDMESRA